ncbi:MAG TPA: PAS domain-containing sensor histidine kinase, partial [Terriglobia bacterium]|nr:PAS domain-containing sensor histidine kinase [Terriglobia bacterium]
MGKSIFEVLPNSITGALKGPLLRTVEVQEAVGVEVYDDTSARTYEVRSFWSPEGILVYFHNITDRIRANEAITQLASEQERANALLDSLLTHAPLGFAFVDSEGHIERVNSQFESMAGISADSALGREIHELFPSFGPLLETKVREVFESGQAVEQMELSDKSGIRGNAEKHWQAAIYPVSSLSGETRAVGTVLFDISNRKQMEEQLRESEGRFRGLADNAPLMIWVCDREGKASWFNRLWLEFRNLTLEEAVAEGSFAEVHPDDQPWVTEAFHNASMAVEPFVIEYRLKDHNQEYRWIHVKANPIASDGRNADTYLFSGIDVTERIAMEENLRRSLANERIARSESDEANRLKDEFLASLSHELRTPLTSMLGWAELLNKPQIQHNELVEGLSIIQRSCKLQLQLINDLLDMSRINIGKLSLEFEFVELFDLTQSVVDMIRSSAADKNIELRLTGGDDPVIVRADPDRFVQIIWNLLTNAIKFTPSGGAVAVNVSKSGSVATLSVTDTGIGVDEKDLPMIFDRFRQVDSTRSRRHGGLGLGLTIAKH